MLLPLLLLLSSQLDPALLKTGDVILQTTTSAQAPAIVVASASPYSHVGIVVVEKGVPSIIEAVGPVKKTKLSTFLARGVGEAYTVLRHQDVGERSAQKIARAAKQRIGKPYDLAFSRGDGALYCSELVAVAYREAGIELRWQKVKDLHLDNPVAQALLDKRWKLHPRCKKEKTKEACLAALAETEIITPGSLRDDENFAVIASAYPLPLR